MGNGELESIYQSTLPFEASRIQAAAIYCSDGRFGEHMDDFLHNALKLPRYDRLTIPGGVACLGGHFRSFREEDALLAHLRFLIAVHRLRRVVLIAHEDVPSTPRVSICPRHGCSSNNWKTWVRRSLESNR